MEKELPKNWIQCNLFEIANVITGKKDASHSTENGIYTFFTCAYEPLKSDDYDYDDEVLILPGNGANVGEVFYFKGKFQAYQRTYIVEKIKISPKYLYYYFLSNWRTRNENEQFGTATNYIKIGNFQSYNLEIAPIPEQKRIVDKLDRLFGQLEVIKTSMEKIPVLLKNFRQQVLTQAVISTDTLKLKKVLVDIKYGTSKKSDYEIIGTPILRIPNIDNGYINDSDLKFSVLDKKELETLKLKENDILIIRSNGSVTLVGQSAIVTKEFESYSYAGYLIRIRLNEQYDSKYLNYIFKSNFIRSQMIDTSRSTSGINNINSKEIQDLNIPNIKVEEQREIVSRIENLFSKADAIEEKYKNLKAKIETLPQTILHKAFKGELTEQLDDDGDARDLLEEIMTLKRTK